mgnify:CR=1 FL=1
MRKSILLSVVVLLSFSVQAQVEWKADQAHSSIQFEVSHLTISSVTGMFNEFSCVINANKDSFEGAQVSVEVKVPSLSTENLTRDKHLKEDDFFNANKFPSMTFKSQSFKLVEKGVYEVTGELTIRDVTRVIKFNADYKGSLDTGTKTISAFKAEFTINRFEYQLSWDDTLDTGSLVVGEDVRIILNMEFVKS